MGLFNSGDTVKISGKTGGAYSEMSDVIDNELDDIFGSEWTSHQDSNGSKHDCHVTAESSKDSKDEDRKR
jgi:hypothetical protein